MITDQINECLTIEHNLLIIGNSLIKVLPFVNSFKKLTLSLCSDQFQFILILQISLWPQKMYLWYPYCHEVYHCNIATNHVNFWQQPLTKPSMQEWSSRCYQPLKHLNNIVPNSQPLLSPLPTMNNPLEVNNLPSPCCNPCHSQKSSPQPPTLQHPCGNIIFDSQLAIMQMPSFPNPNYADYTTIADAQIVTGILMMVLYQLVLAQVFAWCHQIIQSHQPPLPIKNSSAVITGNMKYSQQVIQAKKIFFLLPCPSIDYFISKIHLTSISMA